MGQRLADYGHERCARRVVGRGEIAASEKGNAGGFEVVSLCEVIRRNDPAFPRRFYIAFRRNQTSRSLTHNWNIRGKANRLHARVGSKPLLQLGEKIIDLSLSRILVGWQRERGGERVRGFEPGIDLQHLREASQEKAGG